MLSESRQRSSESLGLFKIVRLHIPELSLISAGLMHPKAFEEFISDSKVTPVKAHVAKGT